MGDNPLMRAVVEAVVFLETSDDVTLNPDVAVSQMEQMAAILQELDSEGRQALSEFVSKLAQDEERQYGRTTRVDCISSLIENLGLIED